MGKLEGIGTRREFMKPQITVLSLIAVCCLSLASASWAQSAGNAAPTSGAALKVAIKEAPPFVERKSDGSWAGIGVDLWRRVADELKLEYQWQPVDTVPAMLKALESGRVDVGVAALTMTPERENRIDFTHAYYATGLAIASKRNEPSFWRAAQQLVSADFMKAVAILLLVLLAVGVLVWFVERKRNAAQFGGSAAEGVGSGLWWSAVTMTTVGYGDKAPLTAAGRAIALVWMFASIITVSSFTAAIASAFTVNQLDSGIRNLGDLEDAKALAVKGSAAAEFLTLRGINYDEVEDARTALQLVADGSADALVHDAPLMHYYISRNSSLEGLEVLADLLEPQQYAFGVRTEMAQLEFINRAILRITRTAEWQGAVERFLE